MAGQIITGEVYAEGQWFEAEIHVERNKITHINGLSVLTFRELSPGVLFCTISCDYTIGIGEYARIMAKASAIDSLRPATQAFAIKKSEVYLGTCENTSVVIRAETPKKALDCALQHFREIMSWRAIGINEVRIDHILMLDQESER